MTIPIYQKMRQFVKDNCLQQHVIASSMNISEAKLSKMLNGTRPITIEAYFDFCTAVAVDPRRFLS